MMRTHIQYSGFLMGLIFGVAFNAMPAMALTPAAEATPPVAELALPSSAQPAPAVPTDKTLPTPVRASSSAGDPCPMSKSAMQDDPDDLAKVQEDIDRFTLCVQRAQLLERLNDNAMKSTAAADAVLGLSAPMGSGASGVPMPGVTPGMPPLPAASMSDGPSAAADDAPTSLRIEEEAPVAAAPVAPEPVWTIREIFGSSVDMQARLLSPQGDEVKVKTGSRLPDGTAVTSITPSGVSVRSGKTVKTLQWAGS